MALYFWEMHLLGGYRPTDQAVAHIVIATAAAETPGGTDTEEQIAACGFLNCGYTMTRIINISGSLEEATNLGIPICPHCSEVVKNLGYAPDGSDYIGRRVVSNVGLLPERINWYLQLAQNR